MLIDKIVPQQYWVPVELWLRGLEFWQLVIVALLLNFVVVTAAYCLQRDDDKRN